MSDPSSPPSPPSSSSNPSSSSPSSSPPPLFSLDDWSFGAFKSRHRQCFDDSFGAVIQHSELLRQKVLSLPPPVEGNDNDKDISLSDAKYNNSPPLSPPSSSLSPSPSSLTENSSEDPSAYHSRLRREWRDISVDRKQLSDCFTGGYKPLYWMGLIVGSVIGTRVVLTAAFPRAFVGKEWIKTFFTFGCGGIISSTMFYRRGRYCTDQVVNNENSAMNKLFQKEMMKRCPTHPMVVNWQREKEKRGSNWNGSTSLSQPK